MARLASLLLIFVTAFVVLLLVNASQMQSRQIEADPLSPIKIDELRGLDRLAEALRFSTVSFDEKTPPDAEQFLGFIDFLESNYPRLHSALEQERINNYSLLYTWRGSDPEAKPLLLAAHYDVVPVTPGTESEWTRPPFSGQVEGGYLYGRGSIDDKSSLIGICEAVETLLAQGFHPKRTVLLAFGHDEEIGGSKGAAAIAKLLTERGVQAALCLDEGGAITEGIIPGVEPPTAMVGIAEKGSVTLELNVSHKGGHSSMPPMRTAGGDIARALRRLEKRPPALNMHIAARQMFETLAPEMNYAARLAIGNMWLFESLVMRFMARTPSGSATLRTSTAITAMHAGTKDNVLPQRAMARVNFRILPGESIDDVLAHAAKVIDNPRVQISVVGKAWNPSPISDTKGFGYQLTERTLRGLFPDVLVSPGLVVGATDSRYYAGLSDTTLRFLPIRLNPEELSGFHGSNERIRIESYNELLQFYLQLIAQGASA